MLQAGKQRRLAAIMFTDMVGYTAQVQRDEKLALELLEEHRNVLRDILSQHGGVEIKTMGDGFLVEFPSALSAVEAGLAIQGTLIDRNQRLPSKREIWIRTGIHLGDVEERDHDVLGDGVNIAARLEPLARPGGIAISQQVIDQVEDKTPHRFECVGQMELKNIRRPVCVYFLMPPAGCEAQNNDPVHRPVDQCGGAYAEGKKRLDALDPVLLHFRPLRNDARFREVLRTIGLESRPDSGVSDRKDSE